MTTVCQDLRVPLSTFATWLKEFKESGEDSFPGFREAKALP